jgi:hypothetical protein
MIRVVKGLLVCLIAGFAINALAAERRVVVMWTCELNDEMTTDDVQLANGRWVKFINKEVAGGDVRSFVVSPIVGDATKFQYIDSFPSLESWAAMEKAMQTDEGQAIEEALDVAATCASNTLHNAVESE